MAVVVSQRRAAPRVQLSEPNVCPIVERTRWRKQDVGISINDKSGQTHV